MTWRQAMQAALYGPDGFYARGEPPARHFRTSVHVSPRYAAAILDLLRHIDAGLGHPGADRSGGCRRGPGRTARAGSLVPRRSRGWPGGSPRTRWRSRPGPPVSIRASAGAASPPEAVTGLVVASEWLDNIPLDVVELTAAGPVLVQVDTGTGAERPGPPPDRADLAWVRAWWPLRALGDRAEVGRPRCEAWAGMVGRIGRGVALAADYGHVRAARPGCGTLTGYLEGRAVPAIPDGSRDITAHVALDACAAAGRRAGAAQTLLTTQREALRGLGMHGGRPPLALAASDPETYVRQLSQATENAELVDTQRAGRVRLAGPDGGHGPARAAGRAGTLAMAGDGPLAHGTMRPWAKSWPRSPAPGPPATS